MRPVVGVASPWSRIGATETYQIQVFPTLATIAADDRLRVTISTTNTPHLVPIPRN